MDQTDIAALTKGIAPVLRGAIATAVQPLVHRLIALESREPPQGEQGLAGVDGQDGANGAPGEPGEAGQPGVDGKDGLNGADAYPGRAYGLYDPAGEYKALDVVSFNGSEWRARQDDPGDLPGEGWMLSAQRGKRGDRGERGERGAIGKDGKDGAQPVAVKFEPETMQFVMVLDSGEVLEADFEPVLKAFMEMNNG